MRVFPNKILKLYGTLDERNKMENLLNNSLFYNGKYRKCGKWKEENVFEGKFYDKNSLQRYGSNCLCEFQAKRPNNKRRRDQGRFSLLEMKIRMDYLKNADLLDGLVRILKK